MIALTVPAHAGDPGRTLRAELRALRIGQVWLTLGVGAVGFGGFFAAYSYVASIVTDVAGAPAAVVPVILIVMGIGMTIGISSAATLPIATSNARCWRASALSSWCRRSSPSLRVR